MKHSRFQPHLSARQAGLVLIALVVLLTACTAGAGGNRLVVSPYIEQAMVVGDRRNFLTALIVPGMEAIEKYAAENGIINDSLNDLINSDKIYKFIESQISELLIDFARFEKIKKFKLLSTEFTVESGEMTPTLKLKRKVILKNYEREIEEMYQ